MPTLKQQLAHLEAELEIQFDKVYALEQEIHALRADVQKKVDLIRLTRATNGNLRYSLFQAYVRLSEIEEGG